MKNCKVRKNIKIAAWAAAFALAAAVGFGGCTNASDSSGGSGGEPETLKYAVNFNVATEGGEITAALDDGTEINDGDTVEKGKTVTFTARAANTAPKYLIAGWLQESEFIVEAGIKSS